MAVDDPARTQREQHCAREGDEQAESQEQPEHCGPVGQQEKRCQQLCRGERDGYGADEPGRVTEPRYCLPRAVPVGELGNGTDREHTGQSYPDEQSNGSHVPRPSATDVPAARGLQ